MSDQADEQDEDDNSSKPKRQFLKRKTVAVIPSQLPQTKKYNYYAEAVAGGRRSNSDANDGPNNSDRTPKLNLT